MSNYKLIGVGTNAKTVKGDGRIPNCYSIYDAIQNYGGRKAFQ